MCLSAQQPARACQVGRARGGSRIFRTSVKNFLADGALSALGVVSTGRGRLQSEGGSGR